MRQKRISSELGQLTAPEIGAQDLQLGEVVHPYANKAGVGVFSFLRNVVMNLLRRGDYRSICQGVRELAYDFKAILALDWVRLA